MSVIIHVNLFPNIHCYPTPHPYSSLIPTTPPIHLIDIPFSSFNSSQNLIHTPTVIPTPTPVFILTSLLVHMQPSILKQSLSPTPPLIIRFTVEWRHARRWRPNELVSLIHSLLGRLKKQKVNPLTQICHLFFLISMFGKFISFRTISYSQSSFFTTYSRTLIENYLHSLIITMRFRYVKQDLLIFAHISVQLFSY